MKTTANNTIKWSSRLALFVVLLSAMGACNLEKEIEIELPEYESRIFVECYLEPGQPYTLLMTRTSPYFEPFPDLDAQYLQQILVDSAQVFIHHQGATHELRNELLFNNSTGKFFNYKSSDIVPLNYTDDFELEIITKDGKTITAVTRLLPVVPIDSIVVNFAEDDTLARVLTYFTDIPVERNYFRRMLHEATLDSIQQDFVSDDRIVEDVFIFGSGYVYSEGDTVINTIFHIDKAYYDFFGSVQTAVSSNGNPFGQPSPIISNLEGTAGAIGIFTGLSYDRVVTIVER